VTALGTSIRIFLADGTADGLRIAEKSNWTGLALLFPRVAYPVVRKRSELQGPGVYVLFGPTESGGLAHRIYIGESDELRSRLDDHAKRKDFWTKAIVFTSKDANLNKAHVRYLEARLISIAGEAKRAELDNGVVQQQTKLSDADRADAEAFLADMLLLYPVLGLDAFERVEETVAPEQRLHLSGKGAVAEGSDTAEGFVVFTGAQVRKDVVESLREHGAFVIAMRQKLVQQGLLVESGDGYVLTQDYVFSSPSTAAMVLLGRTANGRIEWKDSNGRTLKSLQEAAVGQEHDSV
jgi:hypothetical protein